MERSGSQARPLLIAGGIAQVVGVVALVGFMFLPWYGLGDSFTSQFQQAGFPAPDITANAWRAFNGTDAGLVLCGLVVLGLGLAISIGGAAGMGRTAFRTLSIISVVFAAIAALVIFIKIVNPPGQLDISVKLGAFLGLFAQLVALAGAAVSLIAAARLAPGTPVQRPAQARPASHAPPAGWYPDPDDATQHRYWDGAAWTEHRAPR